MDEYEWESASNSCNGTDLDMSDSDTVDVTAQASAYRIITPSTIAKHQVCAENLVHLVLL